MEDLSLHILDIVENSLRANAKNVQVKIIEDRKKDLLTLEIKDDGNGMDEKTRRKAIHPFFTTKKGKKIGLGLSFLAQSAEEAGGKLKIETARGKGTKIITTFKLSHIDRKPIGNLNETISCLKVAHPDVKLNIKYQILNIFYFLFLIFNFNIW